MKTIVVTKAQDIPKDPIDGKPTLVYWDIAGLAQVLRLTLAAAQAKDWVDVRIDAGDPAIVETYKKVWLTVKENLPLAFPNLPYYLDEAVKLSQSRTILRYLARKYDMMGPEHHETDLLVDQLADLDQTITVLAYRKGYDAVQEWYREKASKELARIQPFLESNSDGAFLCGGSKPSIADISLYVFLTKLTRIEEQQKQLADIGNSPSFLNQEWIQKYIKVVEGVAGVAEYRSSPQYKVSPLNNPHAQWSG